MMLNVFSWNVLSDAYFTADDYPTYNKFYFDSDRKREQVLKQLEEIMKSNTLIALQEVCNNVMPELVKLAVNMNYVMRDAYYGNEKSGNMGVVLMWPNIYKVEKYVQIVVGQHILEETPIYRKSWWDWIRRVPTPLCPIKYAKSRSNVLIAVNLIDPNTEFTFTFAVYHMPCAFWDMRIMQYHLNVVEQTCRELSASRAFVNSDLLDQKYSTPLILCMDMNAKPDSTLYSYLTEKNLVSVHKFENKEPEFTINTHSGFSKGPFKGTIDYLWVPIGWLNGVKTYMPVTNKLLPNDEFPSDHLWTEAELYFV